MPLLRRRDAGSPSVSELNRRQRQWVAAPISDLRGRDDLVADIEESLVKTRSALIWGSPGVGKSEVAKRVAHVMYQRDSCAADEGQLWACCSVNASGRHALCPSTHVASKVMHAQREVRSELNVEMGLHICSAY